MTDVGGDRLARAEQHDRDWHDLLYVALSPAKYRAVCVGGCWLKSGRDVACRILLLWGISISRAAYTLCHMADAQEIEQPESKFSQMLDAAARVPGVRINRAAYLRSALKRHCTEEQIEHAIAESPAAAHIPFKVVAEVANTSIAYETSKVTGLSALAGLPGGLAVIGTVPADLAQYIAHMLRVAQKLAYIYSWPDLFARDAEEIDEATKGILTLFLGVMVGVQLAQGGVSKVSAMIAAQVAKKLPQQALTKGVLYPIVKKVAGYLGVQMTKKLFASGIAKAIPVVGAALSGGLTIGTYLPMTKKLQKHLASLELTKPDLRANGTPWVDAETIGADSEVVEQPDFDDLDDRANGTDED